MGMDYITLKAIEEIQIEDMMGETIQIENRYYDFSTHYSSDGEKLFTSVCYELPTFGSERDEYCVWNYFMCPTEYKRNQIKKIWEME